MEIFGGQWRLPSILPAFLLNTASMEVAVVFGEHWHDKL